MVNFKPKLPKVKIESLRKVREAQIFTDIKLPLIVWLIQFIISEIVISGGLYARSVWLVAIQAVAIISFLLILEKGKPKTKKEKSRVAITNFAVFVILDLAVIYFGLESSNREFFNFYGTWIIYAIVAAYPFVNLKKDSVVNIDMVKIGKSNQDDLLTKDSYSL